MEYKFSCNNRSYKIRVEASGSSHVITIAEGKPYNIEELIVRPNTILFLLNGELKTVHIATVKDKTYVSIDGEYYILEPEKAKESKMRASATEKGNSVASQMPGLLVKIPVSIGDKITAGTILAIVEAMKMQNELRAPQDGVVKKINFKEGEQVDAFVPIVEIEVLSNA